MKYSLRWALDAMIYTPSFIKFGLSIRKLIGVIHRQHGDYMSLLFSQHKESSLKHAVTDASKEVGVEANREN
jgi:hypothetical protein